MKIFTNLITSLILLTVTTAAQAVMINFQTMADGSYGESAWNTLSLAGDFGIDVDISGSHGSADAYAYLDAGTAGLGVCRNLNTAGKAKVDTKTGNGSNLCAPGSDDNVNIYDDIGESLQLLFNETVNVTKIWFNNNHDPDYGMDGDTVVIDGNNHTFGGPANDPDLGWLFEFTGTDGLFNIGNILDIAYYTCTGTSNCLRDEEFYISAIEITSVPEPTALALIGIGFVGIGAARKLKRH